MIAVAGTAVGLKCKGGIEPCAFAEGTYRHLFQGRGLLFLLYFRHFEFPRIPLLGDWVNKEGRIVSSCSFSETYSLHEFIF